jgi:hypothetical protein
MHYLVVGSVRLELSVFEGKREIVCWKRVNR